jgi:outer membrane lipoprotein-sorting protein
MVLSSASCLVRRRRIESAQPASGPLLTATVEELTRILRKRYDAVETLSATVDLEPALLSTEKGEIAEYKDVRGFILIRKPFWIRVIAQYPLVRSTAFDMVSDGEAFRLHIPSRNLLLVGSNEVVKPSKKKLENLRPQHLLEALLIRPPEANEQAVLENWTETGPAAYIVHIIREVSGGRALLDRKVWFDRSRLEITRQQVYDASGDLVTDARYGRWEPEGDTMFPRQIVILRIKDEYQLNVHVQNLNMNVPLEVEKFQMITPGGVQIRQLGEEPAERSAGGARG